MATRGLVARLRAHAVDDPAQLRVELVRIEAARRLRHVDHEVGAALELVRDAHHRDEEPQVGRERLLAREQQERAVLDRVRELVDHVVGFDDVFGGVEVAVEQRLRAARDRFGGERGEPDDVDAQLVEALVERLARLVAGAPSGRGVVVTTPPNFVTGRSCRVQPSRGPVAP